jgi:phosphohistidine swiveling domain-containing protein
VIEAGLGFLYQRELVEASPAEFNLLLNLPIMDTSRLLNEWGYQPAWTASECIDDFALAVRGRVSLGKNVFTLPWRTPLVQDLPAVDEAPADGVPLHPAGPDGLNGEFDTPVDPRFPTFVATNLSEALPGPFSPASASATVRGLRAGGVSIAERLRLPGVIGREVATRSIGTFGHRLYAGVTSTYFMANSMPGTNPDGLTDQFFGRELGGTPVFGDRRPPAENSGFIGKMRNIVGAGLTGVGLLVTSGRESREYVADVDRLEGLIPADLTALDDNRLESLITFARDLVVHGWVLAAWAALLCTATATAAARAGSTDAPTAGRNVASGRALSSIAKLAESAAKCPEAVAALSDPNDPLSALQNRAPAFYRELMAELDAVGHRGPAECELRSTSYADDPGQFARVVAKSLGRATEASADRGTRNPLVRLAGRQIRDREIRRDKVIRSTTILRRLMRELGRRLVERGLIDTVDDVFFFQVDELDSLPSDARSVVTRRRAEMQRLRDVQPPSVFTGTWTAAPTVSPLQAGESLNGLGVSGSRIKGHVRIVDAETIDDLEPGEVLVAEVTDVGYTPSFAYAGAVVTNLGGPMSHAAIVAREFGVTCVVSATNATRRLATGDLVEVDGATGKIVLLER